MATEVMADLLGGAQTATGGFVRFNWKWNRAVAAAIYTNSWQQDYPQLAQKGGPIGWGETCDIVDINNTVIPKPMNWDGAVTWIKQLNATSISRWRPWKICWMYNAEMNWGSWPGAKVTYYPLVSTTPQPQNPIMNMVDANGNYLILTGFGATGTSAPAATAGAAEGVTVTDGTATWTVVSGTSQGFRLDCLPSATGPCFMLLPSYQLEPPAFTAMSQLLNPIPDSFHRHFYRGLESACLAASPNPSDMKRGEVAKMEWMKSLSAIIGQGNKEQDNYRMTPACQPVERRWGWPGPITADQPY
jgi:hypothetical protein